jgi:hypothetical protein
MAVTRADPTGSSGKATLVIDAPACAGSPELTVFVPAS